MANTSRLRINRFCRTRQFWRRHRRCRRCPGTLSSQGLELNFTLRFNDISLQGLSSQARRCHRARPRPPQTCSSGRPRPPWLPRRECAKITFVSSGCEHLDRRDFVQFSLVYEEDDDTADRTVLIDYIKDDPQAVVSGKLEEYGFDQTIYATNVVSSDFGTHSAFTAAAAVPPLPPLPPPPYIAPSPPSPPPPSPPPWPVVAEGSKAQIYPRVLRLARQLELARAATPSNRRRLLRGAVDRSRETPVNAGSARNRILRQAWVMTLDDSNAKGRRLLQDMSPAYLFLMAFATPWLRKGLSQDNVRLGAVTETDKSGISVEFPSFSKRATPRI